MSIHLHPDKGLNPRMTSCRNCGKDIGLVLLGIYEYKRICNNCGTINYGISSNSPCGKCGHRDFSSPIKIEDHEKIPCELCDECGKRLDDAEKAVREGGVHWRCKKCKSEGAVKHSEYAMEIRKATQDREKDDKNYTEPDSEGKWLPCGIEWENCPVCRKTK